MATQQLGSRPTGSNAIHGAAATIASPALIWRKTFNWFKDPKSDGQAVGLIISTVAGVIGLLLTIAGITVTGIQGSESLALGGKGNAQARLSNDYVRLGWCQSISEEKRLAIEWCKLHPTPDTFDNDMVRRSLRDPWEYNSLLSMKDQRSLEAHLKTNGFLVGAQPTPELVTLAAKYLASTNIERSEPGLQPEERSSEDNRGHPPKLYNLLLTPLFWMFFTPQVFGEEAENGIIGQTIFLQSMWQLTVHLVACILGLTQWHEFGQLWLGRQSDGHFWLPLLMDLGRLYAVSMVCFLLRRWWSRPRYFAFIISTWFIINPSTFGHQILTFIGLSVFAVVICMWWPTYYGSVLCGNMALIFRLFSRGIDWEAWSAPSLIPFTTRLIVLALAVEICDSLLGPLKGLLLPSSRGAPELSFAPIPRSNGFAPSTQPRDVRTTSST